MVVLLFHIPAGWISGSTTADVEITAPKVPLLLLSLLLLFSKEADVEAAVAGRAMRYSTSIYSLIVLIHFPSTPLKRVAFAKLNLELKRSNHKFNWARKLGYRFFFFPPQQKKKQASCCRLYWSRLTLSTIVTKATLNRPSSDPWAITYSSVASVAWRKPRREALLGARTFLFAYKAMSTVARTDRITPPHPLFREETQVFVRVWECLLRLTCLSFVAHAAGLYRGFL